MDFVLAQKKKEKMAQRASRLAEMTLGLNTDDIPISHEVRCDFPEADAILRKIDDSSPDLVITSAHEQDYLVGLMTNTDWELIRRSPVPVWFVRDDTGDIRNILTAVGTLDDDEDAIGTADYDVFGFASAVGEALDADNCALHTYELPEVLPGSATYGSAIAGAAVNPVTLNRLEKHREAVIREHGSLLNEFAKHFGLDSQHIRLERGHPRDVLPDAAEILGANLIVLGAINLNRWQRAIRRVTAEPVLARSACDLLVVKDPVASEMPENQEGPVSSEPTIDVEAAIRQPGRIFDSPAHVANSGELTRQLRKRILLAWEQDIRAQIREEDEGGKTDSIDLSMLGQIRSAMENLRTNSTPNT